MISLGSYVEGEIERHNNLQIWNQQEEMYPPKICHPGP